MKRVFLILELCVSASVLSCGEAYAQVINKDTITVSRDGTGDFRNIQDAVEAVRAFRPRHTVVLIKNGTYKEKIVVPTWITDVDFIGEDSRETIITWDDHAKIDNMGTFRTYTMMVQGNDLSFTNLTIENNAVQLGQAVAVHLEGDRMVFRNCRFLGNQDTIYTGREGCRIYFEDCYIEGTTDYIFGPSTCWFERCLLHCKTNSYITAASTPRNQQFGYVFNKCRVTLAEGVDKMYLGRPWRKYAMTLFMNCELPEGIAPEGWHNWGDEENEHTARYMEYGNYGSGAAVKGRVKWCRILAAKEAAVYTVGNVMKGCDGWQPVR